MIFFDVSIDVNNAVEQNCEGNEHALCTNFNFLSASKAWDRYRPGLRATIYGVSSANSLLIAAAASGFLGMTTVAVISVS